jgi:hypothetical protein
MEKLTDNEDDDDDDGFWNDMGHQERRELLCICACVTAALVVETLEGLVKAWQSPTKKLAANKADKADDRNIIMFCSDCKSLRRVNYVLGE